MKCVRLALGGLVLACLANLTVVAGAEKAADKPKFDKEKLVGIWEFDKSSDPKGVPPPGMTVEFIKDGKLKMVIKDLPAREGKYQIDGDTLTVTMTGPDGKEKVEKQKITKLTDIALVIEVPGPEKPITIELKKKK